MERLEQWIESVRQKPEHIRVRYVIGCVAASMVLVIGVWLLSVSEGFKNVAQDAETSEFQQILPRPSDFSLDALIEGKQSLGTEEPPVSGESYFQDQYQGKTEPKLGEEGIQPIKTGEKTESVSR